MFASFPHHPYHEQGVMSFGESAAARDDLSFFGSAGSCRIHDGSPGAQAASGKRQAAYNRVRFPVPVGKASLSGHLPRPILPALLARIDAGRLKLRPV